MQLVYPYISSRWNGTELKYSLRSAAARIPNITDVFIVGDKPNLKGIIHIPATDSDKNYHKERNIYHKLLLACNDPRVEDDLVYMNDDHFLLPGFDVNEYYCAHWGVKRTDMYGQTISNTMAMGDYPGNFDVHCPIKIKKEWFLKLSRFDWNIKAGYCIKTLYRDEATIPGVMVTTDLKIDDEFASVAKIKELIAGRVFFSIHDRMRTAAMLAVLNELYPVKSKWE